MFRLHLSRCALAYASGFQPVGRGPLVGRDGIAGGPPITIKINNNIVNICKNV